MSTELPPSETLTGTPNEIADAAAKKRARYQDDLVHAFMRETGLPASKLMLVEKRGADWTSWEVGVRMDLT